MITICVNVEPYLAHYMYACHANCIREDAIKLSHRTNLYHISLEFTAPCQKKFPDVTPETSLLPYPCPISAKIRIPTTTKHPPAFR